MSPQSSLINSAAGIAAAAAAMQSPSSAGNPGRNVKGSRQPQTSPSKHHNAKNLPSEEYGMEDNSGESSASNDMKSKPLPESSSNVVSSTMGEEEDTMKSTEAIDTNRNDGRRRKAKLKVRYVEKSLFF